MSTLLKVSLRQKAVFIPDETLASDQSIFAGSTGQLVTQLANAGYGLSEELWKMLNRTSADYHVVIAETVKEVLGINKNWTPLVKGWDRPTGETLVDHILTFFATIFQDKGTRLACGHIIPPNTFPLERYNGCPFCGTPFEAGALEHFRQGSKVKVLALWREEDLQQYFTDLLASKTALDATQMDSLKLLLSQRKLPAVPIAMKETAMAVIDQLVREGRGEEVQPLMTSPADILRYLWYSHTGFLQVIEPKVLIKRTARNSRHLVPCLDRSAGAKLLTTASLRLKYNRKECRMVAGWMNGLPMEAEKICEAMHPRRSMWVRFIRALRLSEYSKHKGMEKLADVLDRFYNRNYEVWQGRVEQYRLRYDAVKTFALLKQRPGLFARSLFANMLWFGPEQAVTAFADIIDKVPARLVFTLNLYAEIYFDRDHSRIVKPLGGVSKTVPANVLLKYCDDGQLEAMKHAVQELCLLAMQKRFAAQETASRSIYIDPALFRIPVSIGDRGDTVQDLPGALMGTRFPVEGSTVRLFMQWGNGLSASHLDMDLSCHIGYPSTSEICSFGRLVATGCRHSGDIRYIPEKIGTAEYIDVDLEALSKAGARFVAFTCNAYSAGSVSPNLVVGWMNSRYPMKISEKTG